MCQTLWPTKTKSQKITKIEGEQDSTRMANILNDHFVTVGLKLSEQMAPGRVMHVSANVGDSSFDFNMV